LVNDPRSKKSFSLIEMIFIISIITIISFAVIQNLSPNLNSSNIEKIKADIVNIREGMSIYKSEKILKNDLTLVDQLDDNDNKLFNLILRSPIEASNNNMPKSWVKISKNRYKVFIDKQNSVEFFFDNVNYTFECDIEKIYCKDLCI
jgi:type II secretory pathway pseudopilin PulG